MASVTAVLAEESGIQYQGVQDKSGGTGQAVPSTLIVGKFRRGVFGRTMTITTANIRGMLGYDPENPDYQAVEDALSTGIPSVQVIRHKIDRGICVVLRIPEATAEWFAFRPVNDIRGEDGEHEKFMQSITFIAEGKVYKFMDHYGDPDRFDVVPRTWSGFGEYSIFLEKALGEITVCADRPIEHVYGG